MTPASLARGVELDRRIKLLQVALDDSEGWSPEWPEIELSEAAQEVIDLAIKADLQAQIDAAQAEFKAL